MPTWPATLPPPAISTLNEQPPDNVLRTTMDKGPAKKRRRTTANTRPMTFSIKVTEAQVQELDDFYEQDLYSGSLNFDFTHPRTGQIVEAGFKERPQYQEQEGVLYVIGISLEIYP